MPDAVRPFLDVHHSLTGRTWTNRLDIATGRTAAAIAQRSNISEILARVIAARGVTLDDAEKYLEPTIRGLMPDPSTMTAMDELADRLARAILGNEAIALFGDYDVDGACS